MQIYSIYMWSPEYIWELVLLVLKFSLIKAVVMGFISPANIILS